MEIGQKVKIRQGVNFRYGRGSVRYNEIGEIINIDELEGELTINFPSCNGWRGTESELILITDNDTTQEIRCRECGEIIEGTDYEEIDGEFICNDCFNDNYFYCNDCGCFESYENGRYIEDRDYWVCDNCLDNYHYCEECGTYNYECTFINVPNGDGYYVCESCFDSGDYYYCDNCYNYYHSDDIHYDEEDDRYYCSDCMNRINQEQSDRVYGYHNFRDWKLFKEGEEEPPYYIGKEIELEPKNGANESGVLKAIKDNINAVGMRDGSLRYGGVEVVSHPESWKYLQAHKKNYKKFFEDIEKINYCDCGGCGLHFHVSRPNDNVVSRVIVILESFKEEIKKLSRRKGDFHWSRFLTDTCNSEKEKIQFQSTKFVKDKYMKNMYHDRYSALNLLNAKTIEFRFFKGASTFEEYWGALQFIHNVMEIALKEKKPLNTINWQDLMKGKELKAQAQKCGVLEIDKYAQDTTDIIEKYEIAFEKAKEEIKRILKNMAIYVNNDISNVSLKQVKTRSLTEMQTKIDNFQRDFRYKTNYLQRIVDLHSALVNNSNMDMDNVKRYIENTKGSFPINSKKYEKYETQINKVIQKFEREVM